LPYRPAPDHKINLKHNLDGGVEGFESNGGVLGISVDVMRRSVGLLSEFYHDQWLQKEREKLLEGIEFVFEI
jgi:hypothetical protein